MYNTNDINVIVKKALDQILKDNGKNKSYQIDIDHKEIKYTVSVEITLPNNKDKEEEIIVGCIQSLWVKLAILESDLNFDKLPYVIEMYPTEDNTILVEILINIL